MLLFARDQLATFGEIVVSLPLAGQMVFAFFVLSDMVYGIRMIRSTGPGVPRRTIGIHTHERFTSWTMTMGVLQDKPAAGYHVNQRCIGCCICSAIAPRNFRSNHEEGLDYVYKQPDDADEKRLCAEAMDICPVSAIEKLV